MKKGKILLFLALVLIIILPACAAQTAPPSNSPSPKPIPASPAVTSTPAAPAASTIAPPTSSSPVSPAAGAPKTGGTLKIIVISDIGTMGSPSEASAGMFARVAHPALDYLFREDTQYKLQPRLVQTWDIAPDGKSITFHLRQGVKFQDGTAFNADAVKYNLSNYAPSGVVPAILKNVTSYDVIDTYTIKLNLKAFDVGLMLDLSQTAAGLMASPTALQIKSTSENMAKDHIVGTGPFKFVSYQRAVNVKYTRWDGYYQTGKPYLDAVEFAQIADPVVSLVSLKKGEAQVSFKISAQDAKDLEKNGFDIVLSGTMPTYYVTPDGVNADSPWSNKLVRQAAEYAIDKKTLAKSIGEGYYDPLTQFARSVEGTNVKDLAPRDFDPAKAKQLLTQAGFPNGFKTKLIIPPSANRDVAAALQTYLKDVGISADMDITDTGRFSTLDSKGWNNGLLLCDLGVGTLNVTSMARMFSLTDGTAQNNFSMYRPSGWQALLTSAISEIDDNKRMVIQQQRTKMMYDESMVIPLWATPIISAQNKSVHDLKFMQGGQPHFYEIGDAWLDK